MKSSKKYLSPLYPFLFGWALILYSSSFSNLGLVNGLGQLLLFTLVVCIPIWRTERMSYVDIGWPWGLVLLGLVSYWLSDGYWLRSLVVSAIVILIGLRMGLGALKMWHMGLLKKEFPRYQYQRRRWEKSGKTNVQLALQVDAISQGLANASFLALPVFIIASNTSSKLSGFELAGLIIWALAFVMETLADIQKLTFLQEMKKQGKQRQVCNVGLWRFCRHPNYFAEWMVWNGLIIAAIPSWWALQSAESTLVWGLIGAGLLFTSRMMYSTLVYLTGAVPSEYYSAQKRPDYITYQQRTNRFFPGPPRK
jgi:steroid 5-alpha reductase family enzyme|tara:strand:+ start:1051 stop:1977 length:927 start_codon:yes stop_codon:yes gene_type:complete